MHQPITCKLKSSENDLSIYFYPQICDFDIFVQIIYPWLASQFNLLQKQSLWPGERIYWFSLLLFSLQSWKKNRNKNLSFLNHYSILNIWLKPIIVENSFLLYTYIRAVPENVVIMVAYNCIKIYFDHDISMSRRKGLKI